MSDYAVGFTGTQQGMTDIQRQILVIFLEVIHDSSGEYIPFHHGDCLGADAQAHKIATELGYFICKHPPNDDSKRAFCEGGFEFSPEDYLKRNRAIAEWSDIVFATPKEAKEQLRSGTWATVRYSKGKVIVISPAGKIERR